MKSVREQAAAWFLRLRDGAGDDAARAEHRAWLAADPSHAAEFAGIAAVWDDFDSPSRLSSLATRADCTVARRRWIKRATAGLVIAGAAMLGWRVMDVQEGAPQVTASIAAGTGEIARQPLPDGTRISANARSRVSVAYFADRRTAELVEGDALFEVARDAARPFVVRSGSATITVVGTRFEVSKASDRVRVSVIEGQVRVDVAGRDVASLHPGDVLEVDAAQALRRTKADVPSISSWSSGMLYFDRATLDEVSATLDRYRARPLRVVGSAGQGKRITAVVRLADIEGFVATLPRLADVRIEQDASETRIVAR